MEFKDGDFLGLAVFEDVEIGLFEVFATFERDVHYDEAGGAGEGSEARIARLLSQKGDGEEESEGAHG